MSAHDLAAATDAALLAALHATAPVSQLQAAAVLRERVDPTPASVIEAAKGALAEPVKFVAVRFKCAYCTFSNSKRKTVAAHIGRCWHSPANRTCKSCAFYVLTPEYEPCFPGEPCRCGEASHYCTEEVPLPDLGVRDGFPVVGCPLWALRGGDES